MPYLRTQRLRPPRLCKIMWTMTQLKRELMDYWKLLTEGPLHASEEAAALDLRNDSNSRLLRCELHTRARFHRTARSLRSVAHTLICLMAEPVTTPTIR